MGWSNLIAITSTYASSHDTLPRLGILLRCVTHIDVGDDRMIVDLASAASPTR